MRATSRDRRVGVVAALSWVLAVGVTGVVAARAVAVLDSGATRTGVLSQAEVVRALATARAGTTPTGGGTATPAPSPSPSPSAPPAGGTPTATTTPSGHPTGRPTTAPPAAEVVRTTTVTGGTVGASCRGAAISLLYATPQDGWTVDVRSAGPEKLEVEFKAAGQETTVKAACVGGVPELTGTGPTGDPSPGGHGSDD